MTIAGRVAFVWADAWGDGKKWLVINRERIVEITLNDTADVITVRSHDGHIADIDIDLETKDVERDSELDRKRRKIAKLILWDLLAWGPPSISWWWNGTAWERTEGTSK